MFLLTSVVGGSLALESSYLALTLASHIGLALVTLAIAGYAASRVGRYYRTLPRAFTGLAAFSALGATIAGTVFLLGGKTNAALYGMEGLAILGIVSALVMVVAGGTSNRVSGP
jgi:predicted permease